MNNSSTRMSSLSVIALFAASALVMGCGQAPGGTETAPLSQKPDGEQAGSPDAAADTQISSENDLVNKKKSCQGELVWNFVPSPMNIEGVYDLKKHAIEWKYSASEEKHVGVYNYRTRKIEWATTQGNKSYQGVYNFATRAVEWRISDENRTYVGVYNSNLKIVEWQSVTSGSLAGVYNFATGVTEWKFSSNGIRNHGVYNHNLQVVEWKQSSGDDFFWGEYNYNTGEVEWKFYNLTEGKYKGVYGCDLQKQG